LPKPRRGLSPPPFSIHSYSQFFSFKLVHELRYVFPPLSLFADGSFFRALPHPATGTSRPFFFLSLRVALCCPTACLLSNASNGTLPDHFARDRTCPATLSVSLFPRPNEGPPIFHHRTLPFVAVDTFASSFFHLPSTSNHGALARLLWPWPLAPQGYEGFFLDVRWAWLSRQLSLTSCNSASCKIGFTGLLLVVFGPWFFLGLFLGCVVFFFFVR